MSPELEHKLVANVSTILERSEHQSKMLDTISKKQDITNGRVNTLEKSHIEISGKLDDLDKDVRDIEKKDESQDTEIKKGNAFVEMIKNNWKGAAFVIGVALWIYEHGYIHI
jgi:peptidoglycan hydrolase CwlO-like protein